MATGNIAITAIATIAAINSMRIIQPYIMCSLLLSASTLIPVAGIHVVAEEKSIDTGKTTDTDKASSEQIEKEKGDGEATFQPPDKWKMAESKMLSPNVKALVIGPSTSAYPPSINLATESYQGSLKQYIEIAKSIGTKKGGIWKDLGPFTTKAGKGRLTQLDTKTNWGDVRMLHLIILKDGAIYVLTAAALKLEFPTYYKDIFDTLILSRLHINNKMCDISLEFELKILTEKSMKKYRKLAFMALLTAVFCSTSVNLQAQDCCSVGGVGYEESLVVPSLTPYIALATVATIGLVAIAIRHTGSGHSHSHSHSH